MPIFTKTQQAVTVDALDQQKKALASYTNQFNRAVTVITDTIENLGVISGNMAASIQEIEAYQKDLENTKVCLNSAKEKNDRVIQNFKTLLEID